MADNMYTHAFLRFACTKSLPNYTLAEMNVDMSPLRDLIKRVFVEKNRCRYTLLGQMKQNPICKFFFILNVIFLPVVLYARYIYLIDTVNQVKMLNGEIDDDRYTNFTPYETFSVMILFLYIAGVQVLFTYMLYVIMKECNCARISFVFWESPFWKWIGFSILTYIVYNLLFLLLFNRYASNLTSVMFGAVYGDPVDYERPRVRRRPDNVIYV